MGAIQQRPMQRNSNVKLRQKYFCVYLQNSPPIPHYEYETHHPADQKAKIPHKTAQRTKGSIKIKRSPRLRDRKTPTKAAHQTKARLPKAHVSPGNPSPTGSGAPIWVDPHKNHEKTQTPPTSRKREKVISPQSQCHICSSSHTWA